MGNKQAKTTSFLRTTSLESTTTSPKKTVSKVQPKQNELEKLFNKYKEQDQEEDIIGGEGIMKFLQDLHVDVMDVIVLVMMWKLNVKGQYRIERSEFIEGFKTNGAESFDGIKAVLPKWREEIQDKKTFKQFYGFVFQYSKPSTQKSVLPEIAIPTWKILFSNYSLIEEWSNFIENTYKKPISKDVWEQFNEFVNTVNSDLSNYSSEESAWPVVIDDFVQTFKK